jgi:short-subunit dehydrogenase
MALESKVVIVTGASSGIGAAAARAFGRAGMRVVLTARRVDRLKTVALEIERSGGRALVAPSDAREHASLRAVLDRALAEFDQIDVLFNNAGLGRLGWLERLDPSDVRLQLGVNLLGVIEMTQLVLPHMMHRRSGHIINMSSLSGKIGTPTYTVYAATKFGVDGFTQALRREVAPWGVKVSCVFPGGVTTEFGDHAGYQRRSKVTTPRLLRLTPDDVAQAMVKLVKRPRAEVILPRIMRLSLWLSRLAPWAIDWGSGRFVSAERAEELGV